MQRAISGEASQWFHFFPSNIASLSGTSFTWSEAAQLGKLVPFAVLNKIYVRSQLAKEHLGITNGTSFSASVGALIAFESVGAVVLAEVIINLSPIMNLSVKPIAIPYPVFTH